MIYMMRLMKKIIIWIMIKIKKEEEKLIKVRIGEYTLNLVMVILLKALKQKYLNILQIF